MIAYGEFKWTMKPKMIFFAIDMALIIFQSTVEYDFEAWNRTRKSKQGLENYAQFKMKEIILIHMIVDRREAVRHEQWSDLLIATSEIYDFTDLVESMLEGKMRKNGKINGSQLLPIVFLLTYSIKIYFLSSIFDHFKKRFAKKIGKNNILSDLARKLSLEKSWGYMFIVILKNLQETFY